jgi:hypothetical protein
MEEEFSRRKSPLYPDQYLRRLTDVDHVVSSSSLLRRPPRMSRIIWPSSGPSTLLSAYFRQQDCRHPDTMRCGARLQGIKQLVHYSSVLFREGRERFARARLMPQYDEGRDTSYQSVSFSVPLSIHHSLCTSWRLTVQTLTTLTPSQLAFSC